FRLQDKVNHPPPVRPPSGGRDPDAPAYIQARIDGCIETRNSVSNSNHTVPPARRGADRWGVTLPVPAPNGQPVESSHLADRGDLHCGVVAIDGEEVAIRDPVGLREFLPGLVFVFAPV